jgi:RimJ/RimL family protein N-acetyltransferase
VSVRLQTARLVIRPFEHGDAEAWIAMFSDPEVRRFLPPAPVPTMETFARALESRHAMERDIGYAMWAVDGGARLSSHETPATGHQESDPSQIDRPLIAARVT